MIRKFLCFVGLALLTTFATHAQDRRTIQISETDTITLNPTYIEYVISPNRDVMTASYDEVVSHKKKGLPKTEITQVSMDTVLTLLRNHHIAWTPNKPKGYSIGMNEPTTDSAIAITVHSEVELQSVYALLSPLSGIKASINQIEYEQMPDRLSIYKVIYQRALADAKGMAAVSGKSLGDLVSVEEPQDPLWTISGVFERTMDPYNLAYPSGGHQRPSLEKSAEVRMLFKFELK